MTYGGYGTSPTWSNLKNKLVKQKPKLVGAAAAAVSHLSSSS